jgi:hypothetical protein
MNMDLKLQAKAFMTAHSIKIYTKWSENIYTMPEAGGNEKILRTNKRKKTSGR